MLFFFSLFCFALARSLSQQNVCTYKFHWSISVSIFVVLEKCADNMQTKQQCWSKYTSVNSLTLISPVVLAFWIGVDNIFYYLINTVVASDCCSRWNCPLNADVIELVQRQNNERNNSFEFIYVSLEKQRLKTCIVSTDHFAVRIRISKSLINLLNLQKANEEPAKRLWALEKSQVSTRKTFLLLLMYRKCSTSNFSPFGFVCIQKKTRKKAHVNMSICIFMFVHICMFPSILNRLLEFV